MVELRLAEVAVALAEVEGTALLLVVLVVELRLAVAAVADPVAVVCGLLLVVQVAVRYSCPISPFVAFPLRKGLYHQVTMSLDSEARRALLTHGKTPAQG